jgi:hypothetical protein
MRSDMVPGAIFPDYELSDHTGKRQKLPKLPGQHPMVQDSRSGQHVDSREIAEERDECVREPETQALVVRRFLQQ